MRFSAEAEPLAVLEVMRLPKDKRILLITDHKAIFESQYCPATELRGFGRGYYLNAALQVLRQRDVEVAFVQGEHNPADGPSRCRGTAFKEMPASEAIIPLKIERKVGRGAGV